MKINIMFFALLLPFCAQASTNQTSFTWSHSPTIAAYRQQATNALAPKVTKVWQQLIQTHHWCNALSRNKIAQTRCGVEIKIFRKKIEDLRIEKKTLCHEFVARAECQTFVTNTLRKVSSELLNAGEKLRIAEDL